VKRNLLTLAIVSGLLTTPLLASPETEELRKMIEAQEKQLQLLKQKLEQNEQKLEATADQIEQTQQSSQQSDTTIGGYGELHYSSTDSTDSIDFHRFVLFFGHRFNENVRFFSEVEVEHSISGDGQPGEVEIEQAYIEYDFSDNMTTKMGLFLLPLGIINETHEPPTFYGVERNPVEKNIIPATWWEGGAAVSFRPAPGWAIDGAITSGLNVPTSGGSAYKIRNGREKVAEASAENFAYTGRVKFTGVRGLEIAASYQLQDDVTQGAEGVKANLFTTHLIYQTGDLTLRALYAGWKLDGAGAEAIGRDKQKGFYIEPSYKINNQWGIFARYNEYDNEAGNSISTNIEQTSFGFNYWLDEDVVIKIDIDDFGGAANGDGFNLGMGYQF
jgi:hypothetical protein